MTIRSRTAKWVYALALSASCSRSEPRSNFEPPESEYGPACQTTAECASGLECMTQWNIAHVKVGRTCERPCKGTSDCPSGRECVFVDHGPHGSTGRVCLHVTRP
jgi:hypothetical protein